MIAKATKRSSSVGGDEAGGEEGEGVTTVSDMERDLIRQHLPDQAICRKGGYDRAKGVRLLAGPAAIPFRGPGPGRGFFLTPLLLYLWGPANPAMADNGL